LRPIREFQILFWLRRAITSSGPCAGSDKDLGWHLCLVIR
jgi:hypothetical protein